MSYLAESSFSEQMALKPPFINFTIKNNIKKNLRRLYKQEQCQLRMIKEKAKENYLL